MEFLNFRHLLATAIISSLYTGYQVFRQVQELYTEINLLRPRSAVLITFSFVGDQVLHSFFSHCIHFHGALFLSPTTSIDSKESNFVMKFNLMIASSVISFWFQVMAYLMMSSVSSGIPMTSGMRSVEDNIFTDSLAAAISMSFLAFLCLALSALISGYKLSTQIYS